jgi:hypothetical protein
MVEMFFFIPTVDVGFFKFKKRATELVDTQGKQNLTKTFNWHTGTKRFAISAQRCSPHYSIMGVDYNVLMHYRTVWIKQIT